MSLQLLLQCTQCDATLTAPKTKVREAIRWAEDNHRWVTVGQGASGNFVCPRHPIPCGRCGHHNTTDEEIALRREIRAEVAEKTAQRKATRAARNGNA